MCVLHEALLVQSGADVICDTQTVEESSEDDVYVPHEALLVQSGAH